jgi:WD40 repeat protein
VVRLWQTGSWNEVAALEWHLGAIRSLTFSPDSRWLLSGGTDGIVRLWPWQTVLSL